MNECKWAGFKMLNDSALQMFYAEGNVFNKCVSPQGIMVRKKMLINTNSVDKN